MRLSFIALLLCIVSGIASSIICHGQATDPVPITPADVIAHTNTLIGKITAVSGLIDHLEKDGLSTSSFILVLNGNLRCRLQKEPFLSNNGYSGKSRKVELKSISQGEIGLYRDGERLLSGGDDIVIRGLLKMEMKKVILDNAVIKGTSNMKLRSILKLSFF